MTVIIDMLRLRPGYANGEDRRKIRASPVLEEAANEVMSLFQSINEHVPQSYYDDRTTLITQNNGIITISGGLSMVYFLHDVIRWMNTDAGGAMTLPAWLGRRWRRCVGTGKGPQELRGAERTFGPPSRGWGR